MRRYGSYRYDTDAGRRLLNRLWPLLADQLNYPTPTMKPTGGGEDRNGPASLYDRPQTPLDGLLAAKVLSRRRECISGHGLKDALGFGSYETAWGWLYKLRQAMVRPERERTAERGRGSIRAPRRPRHRRARATQRQGAVHVAVEPDERGRLGRVRLALAEKPDGQDMIEFASAVVTPSATICTDGARMSRVLPHYFDEFTFRFNRRTSKARGMLFYRLLQQAVDTDLIRSRTLSAAERALHSSRDAGIFATRW